MIISIQAMAKSSQRATLLSNAKAISFTSEAPLVEESSFDEFDKLFVRNSCSKTIWVAVHYFGLKGQWKTISWFRFEPGEKHFIARTKNRMFYIHAISSDGNYVWQGDDSQFSVKGLDKPVGFKGYRITSDSWGSWGHVLTCQTR